MQHTSIDYFVDKDRFIGELVYTGKLDNSRPVVIIFHAMEGRGQFCVDYAKKLAENGFVAFVADIYGDGKSTHDFANTHECNPLKNSWTRTLFQTYIYFI